MKQFLTPDFNFKNNFLLIGLFGLLLSTPSMAKSVAFESPLDTVPPSVNFSTNSLSVTGAFTVLLHFSELVNGLELDDFELTNGSVKELDGQETQYSVVVEPITGGIVSVKLKADAVKDVDGNGNLASGLLSVTFVDEQDAGVELSTDSELVDGIFDVTVAFTEPVIGLALNDFNVSNGAAIDLQGGDLIYTLTINPGATGAIAVFLPASSVTDGSGNPNTISNFLTVNFAPLDALAPTVELSTNQNEVNGPFTMSIQFNEWIDGIGLEDFELTNAEVSDLLGNGKDYTVLVSPLNEGEVRVRIPEERTFDLAGNANEASNELVVTYVEIDQIAPTVVLSTAEPVVNDEFQVHIHFSEAIEGLELSDFVIVNGQANHLSGSVNDFVLHISPLDLGIVKVVLPEGQSTDLAGNQNLASNELLIEFIDGIRPVAQLTTALFDVEGIFEVQIVFTEMVEGLDVDDFVVINGLALELQGTSPNYTLLVEPDLEGNVAVSLPANSVVDAFGNGNEASAAVAVSYTGPEQDQLFLDLSQEDNSLWVAWTTNTDYKNDHFVVEHGVDGINFTPIFSQASSSNSNELRRYEYEDVSPAWGTNYYRIKQVFRDSSFVYSTIQQIEYRSGGPDVFVYPSPAQDFIYLNLVRFAGIRCEVILYNSLGRVFYQEIFEALPDHPIRLDVSLFQDGVYGVQFRVKEIDKFDYKFMILKDF
ncbi:MAG: Ig-like domain-containing protein [Bacteroidota bacterium]